MYKRQVEYGLNPSTSILKYYRSNKEYSLPAENEVKFAALDQPFSKIRIILLVQIGKEGWDCRSLTGVILSQTGDSPKNMVLQKMCIRDSSNRNEVHTVGIVRPSYREVALFR